MRDINLLPEDIGMGEIQKEPAKPILTARMIIIAAAVIAFAAASLLLPKVYVKTLDMRLASIQDKLNSRAYEEVKTVNKQLETVNSSIDSKMNIINDIDTKGCSTNAVLNTIKQCLPEGCSIDEIGINSSSVTVKGKAPSSLIASEFLLNVQRLGFFNTIDNLEKFTEPKNNSKCNFEYVFTVNGKGGK